MFGGIKSASVAFAEHQRLAKGEPQRNPGQVIESRQR
jgi:hypothetical protein